MSWLNIFGGDVAKGVADVAKEWIETDKESAEAKAIMVQALDPNGAMRRDLSRFASCAFGFYLVTVTGLLYMTAFNIGDSQGAQIAADMMTDLFLPITASWSAIVGASFGVNISNTLKGK